MRTLLQKANAFIFPGIEDFGIIAVEAIASGTPVLAYNKGGASDFVTPMRSGQFFEEQSVESLIDCIKNYKKGDYQQDILLKSADSFSQESFESKMRQQILNML